MRLWAAMAACSRLNSKVLWKVLAPFEPRAPAVCS